MKFPERKKKRANEQKRQSKQFAPAVWEEPLHLQMYTQYLQLASSKYVYWFVVNLSAIARKYTTHAQKSSIFLRFIYNRLRLVIESKAGIEPFALDRRFPSQHDRRYKSKVMRPFANLFNFTLY